MAEGIDLWTPTAAHLAGRPVLVRWRSPVWSHALAAAYKTREGGAVIDIYPYTEARLSLYLHELAHLKLDWATVAPADYWRAAPRSIKITAQTRQALRATPRESKADDLAAQWLDYAERNAWRWLNGWYDLDQALLLALQTIK